MSNVCVLFCIYGHNSLAEYSLEVVGTSLYGVRISVGILIFCLFLCFSCESVKLLCGTNIFLVGVPSYG